MFSVSISQDVRKPRLENGSVHLKENGSTTVCTKLRSVNTCTTTYPVHCDCKLGKELKTLRVLKEKRIECVFNVREWTYRKCFSQTVGPSSTFHIASQMKALHARTVRHVLSPPLAPSSDGSVGQLLLLAHHRGSGDHSEASECRVKGYRGRLRRSGWWPFRWTGRDDWRDGANF